MTITMTTTTMSPRPCRTASTSHSHDPLFFLSLPLLLNCFLLAVCAFAHLDLYPLSPPKMADAAAAAADREEQLALAASLKEVMHKTADLIKANSDHRKSLKVSIQDAADLAKTAKGLVSMDLQYCPTCGKAAHGDQDGLPGGEGLPVGDGLPGGECLPVGEIKQESTGRMRHKALQVNSVAEIDASDGTLSKPELIYILLHVFKFPIKKNKDGQVSVNALKRFEKLTVKKLAARFNHCLQTYVEADMPSIPDYFEPVGVSEDPSSSSSKD